MDEETNNQEEFEKVTKELWLALGVDEKANEYLVAAAKRELGIDYEYHQNQLLALLTIHADYLQFYQLPEGIPHGSLSEKNLKNAEIATKEYKIALRDCGFWGAGISHFLLKDITETLQKWREMVEHYREPEFVFDIKSVFFPRGSPGKPRLRFYIHQMARWYKRSLGKKPAAGKGSPFPRLISACLAIIDDYYIDKDPPYRAIENVLEEMDATCWHGPRTYNPEGKKVS